MRRCGVINVTLWLSRRTGDSASLARHASRQLPKIGRLYAEALREVDPSVTHGQRERATVLWRSIGRRGRLVAFLLVNVRTVKVCRRYLTSSDAIAKTENPEKLNRRRWKKYKDDRP